MELLLISDSRLKVILSREDMEKYSLSAEMMDYDNTETRRAFWSILDEAKHRTGFDAAADRVFVQVYPSRCGGCEMFVTKLGEKSERKRTEETRRALTLSDGERSLVAQKGGRLAPCSGAYRFADLSLLLSACRSLAGGEGVIRETQREMRPGAAVCESSAYIDEKGRCYLLLSGMCAEFPRRSLLSPAGRYESYAVAGEYGEALDGEKLRLYIAEHCTPLREGDAVPALASFA